MTTILNATLFANMRSRIIDAGGAGHGNGHERRHRRIVHGPVHGRDPETDAVGRSARAAGAATCGGPVECGPSGVRRTGQTFRKLGRLAALGVALLSAPGLAIAAAAPSLAEIVAASPRADWRTIDPENTVYLDLEHGRVIIELAPRFAPNHVDNIRKLMRAKFFDGLFIVRSQDNYVVQFGDAEAKRPLGGARRALAAEFSHRFKSDEPLTRLPDPDTYASAVGFTDGFPAARDPATGEAWLTHCYGMVGAGRDNDADSGSGAELYAVIGQAPRQLDRNVTLVGRVVRGMELLSVAARGTGELGFYTTPAERLPIKRVALAADLPLMERVPLEALRTDSPTFAAVIQNRRFRQDAFYKRPAGAIDVCNLPLPVRDAPRP